MTVPDLVSEIPELVEQLRSLYGLPEAAARRIAADPEFAAMARSLIEGRMDMTAALRRMDAAVERLNDMLARSAGRR